MADDARPCDAGRVHPGDELSGGGLQLETTPPAIVAKARKVGQVELDVAREGVDVPRPPARRSGDPVDQDERRARPRHPVPKRSTLDLDAPSLDCAQTTHAVTRRPADQPG